MILLNKARQFARFSQQKTVSLVDNSDEILKQLSDLKSFDKRVEFARERFDELGEGSSRTIFLMTPSLVLKVAHNDKGLNQNEVECRPRFQVSCVNQVLFADPDFKWLVVRKTEEVSHDLWEKVVGINFDKWCRALRWVGNNEIHDKKPKDYEKIIEIPLFKCLSKLILDLKDPLQIGDTCKLSSYGIDSDGNILLRDFGLSKNVWHSEYEGDENNSTDTP